VAFAPDSPEARAFIALAQRVAEKLSAGAMRAAPRFVLD
jgi:hypothetical protein